MNECEHILTQLSLYIDNELTKEEKGNFEAHINTCESCKTELSTLSNLVNDLGTLPLVEPPPWLHSHVMTRIRNASKPLELFTKEGLLESARLSKKRHNWQILKKHAFSAAGVIGVFLLFGVVLSNLTNPQHTDMLKPDAPNASTQVDSASLESTMPSASRKIMPDLSESPPAAAQNFQAQNQNVDPLSDDSLADAPSTAAGASLFTMAETPLVSDAFVKTFYIDIEVDNIEQALATIESIQGQTNFSEITQGNRRSVTLSKQSDAIFYPEAMATLRELGRTVSESERIEQVGLALSELEVTLKAKTSEATRLFTLLESTPPSDATIAAEIRLAQVQTEQTALSTQINAYYNQINNPTLHITLALSQQLEAQLKKPTLTTRMHTAFFSSIKVFVVVFEWVVVVISTLFMPICTMLLCVIFYTWFNRRRKKKDSNGK